MTVSYRNVTKTYDRLVAVHPVTLEIPSGAWYVIVGENGSGKTTLMSMTSGLLTPTKGEVLIDGEPAGSPLAREAVSFLSDSPAFYSDLSVSEHFDYLAGLFDNHSVADRALSIVRAFGLQDRVDDLPETFSRGMKQKTAIALALARPSTVLLLDEPTRGLDVAGAATMIELLLEAQSEGATVITVTHEPERFAVPGAMELKVHDGIFEDPTPMP